VFDTDRGTSQYWEGISQRATVSSTNLNRSDEDRTRASAVTVRPVIAWVLDRQLVLRWLNERENEERFQTAQDKIRRLLIAETAMNLQLSEKSRIFLRRGRGVSRWLVLSKVL
jgi:CRP-like cAMP-binding protein